MFASQPWLPILYALFIWWLGTGLVLYLDKLPRRTFRWSMGGATTLLVASFYGIAATSADATDTGAYIAFTCAVVIWGWHEMSYYMGILTGPRMAPCPDNSSGWRRFVFAVQTCLYHELGILASAGLLMALVWAEPNQIGLWTFAVLWLMRISAKLNVFFGVRNLNEEWLPEQLRFLKSYVTHKPMNLLFPVSISVSTVACALLVSEALASGASAFETAGLFLVATLLLLAILEHWFLMLPISVDALWSWGFGAQPEPTFDAERGIGDGKTAQRARPADSLSVGSVVLVSDAEGGRNARPLPPPHR
jgi:putative photosynthetic complex assembly protein 2